MEQPERDWKLDPLRLPQRLEINLPTEVLALLQRKAESSGRSIDEIILEVLDRELHANE